jgi:hypothetical protein
VRAAVLARSPRCAVRAHYGYNRQRQLPFAAHPAIAIARSLTNTFSAIRPSDAPAFILAQFAGALVALAVGRNLFPSVRQNASSGGIERIC